MANHWRDPSFQVNRSETHQDAAAFRKRQEQRAREAQAAHRRAQEKTADRIDGYDRDDRGESPDF